MRRRGYGSLFLYTFLKHGNCYSYQILSADSNTIILSFMKEIHRRQAFKKLAGKNTALTLTKYREGIVSKKICGNFDFYAPLLTSSDNLKKLKFTSRYHTTEQEHNTEFTSNTMYLLHCIRYYQVVWEVSP